MHCSIRMYYTLWDYFFLYVLILASSTDNTTLDLDCYNCHFKSEFF